jgi:predicted PurR-regulated permease PerM
VSVALKIVSLTRRQRVLFGLAAVVATLTLAILSRVLSTTFFAITVAYVLYPVRKRLVDTGLSKRVAAVLCTTMALVAALFLVVPLAVPLYLRRRELLGFLRAIPAEQPVSALGFTYVIDVSRLVRQARGSVIDLAVDLAGETPVIALKVLLFVLVIYGLLLRPGSLRQAARRSIPGRYHDIVNRLHVSVRETLYALYVLQAATAFGTFLTGYVVFAMLGYDNAFSLAVLSGILQFIPVLGPTLIVVPIAGFEFFSGAVVDAALVFVLGSVFVGFIPDALIRPRLAPMTTGMPASLYFVGFTGGILSLGIVGIIAGPLVVAVFVEVVKLLADERTGVQADIEEWTGDPEDPS